MKPDDARMRMLIGCLIAGAAWSLSGCTNAILGTLLAPEAVVGGAASSAAEVGARSLSGASLEELSDLGSTVGELDRILQEHPDAANADRLRELRDSLAAKAGADSGPDQRRPVKEPPRPRRPTDTKMPLRKGDNLLVSPPKNGYQARRPSGRPDTLPTASSLAADPLPVHAMSLQPVRLPR